MIAISDAVLILVSATALAAGLYRWDNNMELAQTPNPPAITAPSSQAAQQSSTTQASVPVIANNASSVNDSNDSLRQNTNTTTGNNINRVVEVQAVQNRSINVGDDAETNASNEAVTDLRALGTYTVVPGDSLSQIAATFGTSVRSLQEINEIEGSLIRVGQELRYPLPAN